jgi:hypothetical protein
MGNCQAAEAAAVVIQHPGGKVERLYGPATAADVMRGNPGHYVALVVLRVSGPAAAVAKRQQGQDPAAAGKGGAARITKVKLLKPKDALLLGQVYRLITSQGACPLGCSVPWIGCSVSSALLIEVAPLGLAEVARAIQARRQDKLRPRCEEAAVDGRRPGPGHAAGSQELGQSTNHPRSASERNRSERDRHRSGRGRHWQPSLHSISEFPS